jgi:hypothetical protein
MLKRTILPLLVLPLSSLSSHLTYSSFVGTIGDPRAMLEQSGSTYSLSSLPFESCQVSLASCRLLKLVHEVVFQPSVSSPSLITLLSPPGDEASLLHPILFLLHHALPGPSPSPLMPFHSLFPPFICSTLLFVFST